MSALLFLSRLAMCEAVCDVGGVTVSKAVKLSVLPSDSGEDINFLETLVVVGTADVVSD